MENPQRSTSVVTEAVGDGLGVFDPIRQQSYILNATSALVFQHADGQTTPQQLTELLRQKFNVPRSQADKLLWLALDELEKSNLLHNKVATTQAPRSMLTRRQVMATFAAAGLSLALLPIASPVALAYPPVPTTTAMPPTTTAMPPTTTAMPPTTTAAPPTFPFTGFFPPVDNPPTFNEVKAGQSVPVKFSLGGDQGLNILAPGYPTSQPVACDNGAPTSPVEETTTSPSGLHYGGGQYNYVWKTEKSWAGTCRKFILRLTDNTDHVAFFSFK